MELLSPSQSQKSIGRSIGIPTAFAAVMICLFFWQNYSPAIHQDFLNLYAASSLARDGRVADIYDPHLLLAREREIIPETGTVTIFSRPPFYALVLAPLSRLPYRRAYAAWVLAQVLSLAGCWTWAFRRFGHSAAAYTCLYLPPMAGIASGQDCVFSLLIVIVAYLLAERGKEFLSGLALGLGLFKFHLFVLWPIAALAQRRWKLLIGFLLSCTLEVALSLRAAGSAGLHNYVRLLGNWNSAALHPAPEKVISLWGVLASLGIRSVALAAVLAALCAATMIFAIRNADLAQLFTVATAGSLAIVPHVYMYDATVLLLPLWLAIFNCRDEIVRNAGIVIAKPFLFAALLIFLPPLTAAAGIGLVAFALISAWSDPGHWAAPQSYLQPDAPPHSAGPKGHGP